MTSVWKRLQRVGKKASKFQFTASYQSLTVECTRGGKWQPNKLVVVWTRRKRRKLTKSMPWQPGISNPFRGIIVWPEPEPIEITVTLYKDSKPASQFEDKEWTFVIEDESQSGRRKPIASGAINMVDYASVDYRTFDVQLTLKLASKKLVSASLDFTLSCVLIKEGMATDEDMISLGSMLSLNENYCLDDNNDSVMTEVEPSPKFRHKRNLSHGSIKIQGINAGQESDGVRSESPTASPVPGREKKKRGRIRSKSALGENAKTVITELQKEDSFKRLSNGSDASFDASDTQELTRDKSKMESELIKWARSRTKGYRGVKVRNMTTSWKDGLAFCAILHSFEPEKIDFASLDSHKVKQNNKLAFSAFEKLGIPRLLDPTQMMLTAVPDKLSVMTYVYQIKAHFNRQATVSPSSNNMEATAPKQTPAFKRDIGPQVGMSDVNLSDAPSRGTVDAETKESAENGAGEGYNPFLDDDENIADSEAEVSAVMLESNIDESGDQKSIAEKEKSIETTVDTKASLQEPSSENKGHQLKSKLKAPPKPPRLYPDSKSQSVEDIEPEPTGVVSDKSKVESSGQNPFDEVSDVDVSSTGDPYRETKLAEKRSEEYNPFDEDDIIEDESQGKSSNGYNPFEEQNDAQAESDVVKKSPKESSGMIKRTVSYPHEFNPFEEEVNSESIEVELQDDVSDKQSSGKSTVMKSYNPFDDDDDDNDDDDDDDDNNDNEDENQSANDGSAVSTSKSSNPFENENDEDENVVNQSILGKTDARSKFSGENVHNMAKPRVRSPANVSKAKTPDGNVKKRRAPPPPSSRSLDDPWTAKLPEDTAARRRRPAKTTGTREQPDQASSPARTRPKRPAPAPPRRPPLIPTFDQWKSSAGSDGSVTGTNQRTNEVSISEDSLSRKQSTGSADKTTSTDRMTSGRASPGATENNPADIKLLARQVLMDARRKAGASGSLPRERVAKISREKAAHEEGSEAAKGSPETSKRKQSIDKARSSESLGPNGPTFVKRAADSGKGETLQDKSKEEDQGSATRRANLKLRKEELQRRKKAKEKAQRIVQTAVAGGKSETIPPLTDEAPAEQTRAEETKKQEKDVSETDAAGDKKVAGNKNLEHRPLKLKDKENSDSTTDLQERKSSTEQEPEPEKSGFKESEELQRIRAILNQGKPSTATKNTTVSETHRTQNDDGSLEVKKKLSDTKQSDCAAANGVSAVRAPKPLPRFKERGPNAGIEAYVESRKMNFQRFEMPPSEAQQNSAKHRSLDKSEGINDEDAALGDKEMDVQEDQALNSEDQESQDQTPEFQDKSDYLRRELKSLEEEQVALDKVGGKLETELRRAMQCKGCEDEQEKLMQDWFLLVNKKNELVRRQAELNLMKNEEDLERSHLILQRELRALLDMKESEKTGEQRKREQELIEQLVSVVNKRDELVQFEDTHLQQAEEDALHLQNMIDSVKIPKDKGDCVLQ